MSENHDSEISGVVEEGATFSQSSANQEVEPVSQVDSKEDMFVDASDELNNDNKEVEARQNDDIVVEERPIVVAKQLDEMDNGVHHTEDNDNNHFVREMDRLRALLEQAVDEKDNLEIKYKEEREALLREIYMKDQEIEGLNVKVMSSVAEAEALVEKKQQCEVALKRILHALGSVIYQGDLVDDSGGEHVDLVEKSTVVLIEKYNRFLFEINQLRQCLTKAEFDFGVQELGTVFVAARDELSELRRKEAELVEKIALLEDENRKLIEQVESEKAMMETLNLEIGKTKAEVEQEKMRCAHTKEKLSMAVTKGKALVHQRDALKQSLAEKTSELEKCLIELQQRSSALEAAELNKEELVKSENLVASLQESLSQKTLILETFEHILSQVDLPEELQSMDILGRARWLANERNELKGVSLEFYRLKDAIYTIDFPENVPFSDLDSRLVWLKESFYQAKDEINMLYTEIATTKETAHEDIEHMRDSLWTVQQEKDHIKEELDHLRSKCEEIVDELHQLSSDKDNLSASLAAELTEKDYIQKELDDLTRKYENLVEKVHQLSSEKYQTIRMLVEGSGIMMDDQERIEETYSNLPILIESCFGKVKEQASASLLTPYLDTEIFEKLHHVLYVRSLELALCEEIINEDILVNLQLNDLSNQLTETSREIFSLKEEKDVLQKDLERSEEKAGMLREKLSMAVKKGKGLVQDRENLKLLLEDKNSKIEKLRVELQQLESTIVECRDQISSLSTELGLIPELKCELAAMKEQRDQFEKFLFESNNILQKLSESIDHIPIPLDSAFEEPIEKLNWIAGYIDDCQTARAQTEQELREVKEEASNMSGKLVEAQTAMKLLEDALADVKNDFSQLAEEKKEMEFGKENIEIEFQKAIEQAHSQISEISEARSSLEEALSVAENKISLLISEKEEVQGSRAASEMEVDKVRGEVAIHTSRLTEACKTIKSLENALSQADMNVFSLTEQINEVQVKKLDLENELKNLKDINETQASKLVDAGTTIKSLEDALVKADKDFSSLQDEKRTVDEGISSKYEDIVGKLHRLLSDKDHLSASLTAELTEKDYIQKELDDLISKYENLVDKVHQLSSEKYQTIKMLVEGSGIMMGEQERIEETYSNLPILIESCFGKVKEQASASLHTRYLDIKLFEKLQHFLYVRSLELALCEEIINEDSLVNSQLNDLSNRLTASSQELISLNEEKDVLQKDLERSEEKAGMLREKLSMAVKKGKGLVQDRENLKLLLEEKNSEIEKLRLELQQQESTIVECKDQISSLSTELGHMPELKSELTAIKEQRDQFEKFLFESNNILQKVSESIDRIPIPVDPAFEEPIEKLNWLVGYIADCQSARGLTEQELREVKEEASNLSVKLAEAQAAMKLLEDALATVKNDFSQLSEEKKNIEIELQKAIKQAHLQIAEISEARSSLEEALSLAENKISLLVSEKEEVQGSRAASEIEVDKAREEVAIQTSRLTEACSTIKSLENALSQAEMNVVSLNEQSNNAHVKIANLENELKNLKDTNETQGRKLVDAGTNIKSLEDALAKAEKDFSALQDEKRTADKEISTLNSKLNACMEELAGTSGSLASRSIQLIGHLNNLQMLFKDQTLLSTMKQCFDRTLEHLKEMDLSINNTRGHFVDQDSELLQGYPLIEDIAQLARHSFDDIDNTLNDQMEKDEANMINDDGVSSYFRRTSEGFQLQNKMLADGFQGFSSFLDKSITVLLKKLQATKDEMVETMECLKQNVKTLEMYEQENTKVMALLQNDVAVLHSACTDAIRDLHFGVKDNLIELSNIPGLAILNQGLHLEMGELAEDDMAQQDFGGDKCAKTSEKLLAATNKVQSLVKMFETISRAVPSIIHNLKKELEDTRSASKQAIEEKDEYQSKVFKLESDIEALEDLCREARLKLDDYQVKEDKWTEKEAEFSSLYNSLLMQEKEAEEHLLSESQLRTLLGKLSGIEVPFVESEDLEPHSSPDFKKLFSIVDSYTDLQNQINLLSYEKEELESTLSRQVYEIESLKEEIGTHGNTSDLEKMKVELSEAAVGLEKVLALLGGTDLIESQNSVGMKALLPLLEKQVNALLLEAENSKSQAQQLGTKLLGSQKITEDLSMKVKLLEDSLHSRTVQSEIVQERSIFEAPSASTGSEASEIEDTGLLGKKTISPVSSAAHARTMRKGSTDHLVLNVDSESDRLISSVETDEDKGHLFKSLNTSGVIPRQGKMIADRVDGIWVSGGRILSSRPRARLGLIAYCLLLHMWLLGTIL